MKFPKGREQKGEKKLAYGRYNVKQTPRTANRVPNRNWKLHFFQSSRHRDEQRNVKQNTGNAGEKGGGENRSEKWRAGEEDGPEKARERLRGGWREFLVGFVTSLTTRPKTSTSTERNVGGGRAGYTSHCGYGPDNAILTRLGRPMEVPLCALLLVRGPPLPAFTNLLYTSNSFLFPAIIPELRWRNLFCGRKGSKAGLASSWSARIREFCHRVLLYGDRWCIERFDGFSEYQSNLNIFGTDDSYFWRNIVEIIEKDCAFRKVWWYR